MIQFGPYRNQILATAAATIGALGLGAVLGYSSQALPNLEERIADGDEDMDPISTETKSWIGSIINMGCLAAALVAGVLVEIFGRKMTMLILSPPLVGGWMLIAFATNHAMLIAGRAVTGFCAGGFSIAVPLFVAEMADDSIRGALGSGFQIMITAGTLYSYVLGQFLTWQWLAIVSGIIPVVLIVAIFFVPESPKYLVTKGKVSEAKKSLQWFRRKSEVDSEIKLIEQSVNEMKAQQSSFKDLLIRYNFLPSSLMIALMIFQQLSGINAAVFYTAQIFKSAGSTMDEGLSTIIFGLVQFISTLSMVFVIDRAGRKILLLASSAIMCVSLLGLGLFFMLQEQEKDDGVGWLPLVCLMTFIFGFSIGYGPIPWVMLGELVPQKIKPQVAAVATCINWTLAFLVTKFFDTIQDAITAKWCYWAFAIVCAVGFISMFFLLPETKGKSVEEIERYFGVPQAQSKKDDGKGDER